jgi:hypothetical protein
MSHACCMLPGVVGGTRESDELEKLDLDSKCPAPILFPNESHSVMQLLPRKEVSHILCAQCTQSPLHGPENSGP